MSATLPGVRGRLLLVAILGALGSSSCRGCAETKAAELVATDGRASHPDADETARPPVDVEPYLSRARVPAIGWALVRRDAQESGAVGSADIEASTAASDETAFEAASIAKTIIATCVMQLVEEKRLSLDVDASTYVGFPVRHPRRPGAITLRHLLTHTGALADHEETRAPGSIPLGDFLSAYFADAGARGVFLDAPAGTTYAYSNVGPSLAALAVERVTGIRFSEHASKRVFEPLGMRATAFGRDRLPAGTPVAMPHAWRGGAFVRLSPPSHALYPVVDLFSTPRDLARFARAILRGGEVDGIRILSRESVEEMLRVQLPDAAPDDALGWQVRTFEGRRVFGHEGEDAGASTGLYIDGRSGVAAVVLANGDAFQSGDEARARALGELVTELLDTAGRPADR